MIDHQAILLEFYTPDTDLFRTLYRHSRQVYQQALEILQIPENKDLKIDLELLEAGSMLHDIGIIRCHAPGIYCVGSANYIQHGTIGAEMLRDYGQKHQLDLEAVARISERHTGSGLTAGEIIQAQLPLPPQDLLPETAEEKLICLADKFYSKSGDMQLKPLAKIRQSMAKFGTEPLKRFDSLCQEFHISGC